jgi:periplasmic copper chaperone A
MVIPRTQPRAVARVVFACAVAFSAVLASGGAASAHVETDPGQAPRGAATAFIAFQVPNEEVSAGVVKLQVMFPTEHPITDAIITPMPGWSAQVNSIKLNKPVHQNNSEVTQAVQTIIWSANPGSQIAPGMSVRFSVLAGPMPENTDQLLLPAVQTYSNGDVVKWNQPPPAPGAGEPEHPVPVLKLVTAGVAAGQVNTGSAPAGGRSGPDDTARWIGGVGLAVAVLGLGLGIGIGVRGTRTPSTARNPGPPTLDE